MRLRWFGAPPLAQFDVAPRLLLAGEAPVRILKKGVQLEAYVAVIAVGGLPDGQEHFLSMLNQLVG